MKQFFSKITPKYDKLSHLFWFTLAFIALTTFLEHWQAFVIVLIGATLVEVVYDGLMKKGTPEIIDVFWSILIPTLITFLL